MIVVGVVRVGKVESVVGVSRVVKVISLNQCGFFNNYNYYNLFNHCNIYNHYNLFNSPKATKQQHFHVLIYKPTT
jgi:hypothetical protein